jgi:hypothetical protein
MAVRYPSTRPSTWEVDRVIGRIRHHHPRSRTAAFIVWIWTIVDVVRVPDDSMFKAGSKLVWVLVIVLTGVVGAIIDLVVGRPSPGGRAGASDSYSDPNQPPPHPPGAIC